jgi:hypothetical protein
LRALGSGVPTRAICSSLIAEAFHSVRYPILATRRKVPCRKTPPNHIGDCVDETWEARHFSLFAPRDFDVSPYYRRQAAPIVDFDYTRLQRAH